MFSRRSVGIAHFASDRPFNINTKDLVKNKTYVYLITLNDTTTIEFRFGLK